MGKTVILIISLICVCIFYSCAAPPSSINLYSDKPGRQILRGSNVQLVQARTVKYTFDEVVEAIIQSVELQGLTFEKVDLNKGKLTGSAGWNAPLQGTPCTTPFTYAAYIEVIDDEPTSRLTFLLDRHSMCGAGVKPE